MADDFHPGQRWISDSEPELGLGSVVSVSNRTVVALFKASGQKREYSSRNSPLRRVRFRAGDTITNHDGASLIVDAVTERGGLVFYRCGQREFCETELSDRISFNEPQERLFAAQFDPLRVFDLRVAALAHQYQRRKSRVRGFVGGRIDLIPHQLYIASEVAARLAPRVLLADEVGLGKTIEACLILHRLILTGRAQRVLILVPDSLVHQWFVELLRRFNLWFHIFDEERCRAIEAANPGDNPFLDEQFVVCSINLLVASEVRTQQALEAGWDVLVVDEAHHLTWSPGAASPEYALVEALAGKVAGVLLLTATPEQLGMPSHFGRLRLLDPDRFYDLKEFMQETGRYEEVAQRAETLPQGKELDALLDQHGTGRVRFRNTRTQITGFPRRVVQLTPLEAHSSTHALVDWLAGLLRQLAPEKILLICATPAKVAAIDAALRQRIKNVKIAVFHERLSLVQRDRNAAWFAENGGAQILICSEIGSEGRNFQFAHHLVLFDLPFDPELLEQRIGRLDRIGQTAEIQVHVPFIVGSSQEVLATWYHQALDAFEKNVHGGAEILDKFGTRVQQLFHRFPKAPKTSRAELDELIRETQVAHKEIVMRLQKGRDRLLELSSFRPDAVKELLHTIRRQDEDRSLDDFMLSVFDHYGLNVEELAYRTYKLGSAGVLADSFPGLPAEGFTVTCDRARAVAREDVQFLTWDHPLVTGGLDLLLGYETGNSSFAQWPDGEVTALYMEMIYVVECVAPPHLHLDRFLPPTPIRILIDQEGRSLHNAIPPEVISPHLKNGDPEVLLQKGLREQLPQALFQHAREMAIRLVPDITARARHEMNERLGDEIDRLEQLSKVNRNVRPEEIESLAEQRRVLHELLGTARPRLDAIRLIQRGSCE